MNIEIRSKFLTVVLLVFYTTFFNFKGNPCAAEASILDGLLNKGSNDKGPASIVYAKPFITEEITMFGEKIEGTSVDCLGRVYAGDFGNETPQLGQLANEKGEVEQRLFFNSTERSSYFNGIRFLPIPEGDAKNVASIAVVADKKGQVVQVLESKDDGIVTGRVFCTHEEMIEPNDVAVAYKSRRVYSSGLDYAATTTFGNGDIWLCQIPSDRTITDAPAAEGGHVAKPTRLHVQGRANGIEVSNDEKHLFAAETWATDMKIHSNVLWKFEIDQKTGHLSNKQLFFDMKEIDEELQGKSGDIDGVRMDTAGNLFLVRNGEPGEVVKVSPAGVVVLRIKLPGLTEPSNIELGGPDGKSLFIVGKCKKTSPDGVRMGCVDVWEGNEAPGRAFHNLVRPTWRHDDEL